VEESRDAVPHTTLEPASIASIDRLPASVPGWDLAPRRTGVHHREHAVQLTPQVPTGTTSRWLPRRHERRDLLPERLAQRGRPRHHPHRDRPRHERTRLRWGWTMRPSRAMPPARDCLVLSPPLRPVDVVLALGTLGLGQQQE
jgi:hypothetical protein